MGNEKKTPVTIDGVEYKFEDMTQQQQMLLNHVADLDRKLDSARFNVDQMQSRQRCLLQNAERCVRSQA
jgi:hypothetical protein